MDDSITRQVKMKIFIFLVLISCGTLLRNATATPDKVDGSPLKRKKDLSAGDHSSMVEIYDKGFDIDQQLDGSSHRKRRSNSPYKTGRSKIHDGASGENDAMKILKKLTSKLSDGILKMAIHKYEVDPKYLLPGGERGEYKKGAGNPEKMTILRFVLTFESSELLQRDKSEQWSFLGDEKNTLVKPGDKLHATNKIASLYSRKKHMQIKFVLGPRYETLHGGDLSHFIKSKKKFHIALYRPLLTIDVKRSIRYEVQVFISGEEPRGIKRSQLKRIAQNFTNQLKKLSKAEKDVKNYKKKISHDYEEFSISIGDERFYDVLQPFIKQKSSKVVSIDLRQVIKAAIENSMQFVKFLESPHHHHELEPYGNVFKDSSRNYYIYPDTNFRIRNTAKHPMKKIFNKTMKKLQEGARIALQTGDAEHAKQYIMGNIKKLFRKHRKMVGNKLNFHEFDNHFSALTEYRSKSQNRQISWDDIYDFDKVHICKDC